MRDIAILTDFGSSHYQGIIKGVILSINPDIKIIDLTHHISPQNIIEAAFVLNESIPYFRENTIFLAIVDPQVGSNRRGIVVKSSERFFIGPDNGIFEFIYKSGDFEIYEIIKKDFFFKNISNTFHGRDIFAPLAAFIASGKDIKDIIKKIDDPVRLNIPTPEVTEKTITGEIIYIDCFGNLITNIPYNVLQDYRCSLKFKNRRLGRIRTCYSDVPKGFPVAVVGSSGMIEISVYMGSAQKWFNIKRERLSKYKVYVNIRK